MNCLTVTVVQISLRVETMLLAEKVQRVVEMTPAFLSEPEVYFSILSEVGEAINLFKSARRYILGQMKMNWLISSLRHRLLLLMKHRQMLFTNMKKTVIQSM